MVDPEDMAVARFKLEQEDLRRRYRGFAARLQRLDAELEEGPDVGRSARLHAERDRISELLADAKGQLRLAWDQEHIHGRVKARRDQV
jgi:hypothetical protein